MPNRAIDTEVIRKAFDLLAPTKSSKEETRWKSIAATLERSPDWVRKTYKARGAIDIRQDSLTRLIDALQEVDQSDALDAMLALLKGALAPITVTDEFEPPTRRENVNVINLGFIRSGKANYVQRLEMGMAWGAQEELRETHLINDETTQITHEMTEEERGNAILDLINRFDFDARYIDQSYIVPIGTQAAKELCRVLNGGRWVIGKEFSVIYMGVTDPDAVFEGLPSQKDVAGIRYGIDGAERLAFIRALFPDAPLAFVYDERAAQDVVMREQVTIGATKMDVSDLEIVAVDPASKRLLPKAAEGRLVFGYYYINENIGQLVRKYPSTPFVGLNTTDLTRGAVASTGNDDIFSGRKCAKELLVPNVTADAELHERRMISPEPIYGWNKRAVKLYDGLKTAKEGRDMCQVSIG